MKVMKLYKQVFKFQPRQRMDVKAAKDEHLAGNNDPTVHWNMDEVELATMVNMITVTQQVVTAVDPNRLWAHMPRVD